MEMNSKKVEIIRLGKFLFTQEAFNKFKKITGKYEITNLEEFMEDLLNNFDIFTDSVEKNDLLDLSKPIYITEDLMESECIYLSNEVFGLPVEIKNV